jgi:hypothetical protein
MAKTYFEIVQRTAQHGLDEAKDNPEKFRLWLSIWALDVIGESLEVLRSLNDKDKMLEIGDVLWGIGASALLIEMSEDELTKSVYIHNPMDSLLLLASDYSELAKKTARDKRDVQPLKNLLIKLYGFINHEYPVEYCLRLVDQKLMKRYPNGFNANASINRVA